MTNAILRTIYNIYIKSYFDYLYKKIHLHDMNNLFLPLSCTKISRLICLSLFKCIIVGTKSPHSLEGQLPP